MGSLLTRAPLDLSRLVALVSDAVFAEEAFPGGGTADWKERLRESALRQWRCYGRHPWIASTVSLSRPRLGVNGMREMEWALAGMAGLPLPDAEKVRMYLVVTAYVHGAASQLAEERRDEEGHHRDQHRAREEDAGLAHDGGLPALPALRARRRDRTRPSTSRGSC